MGLRDEGPLHRSLEGIDTFHDPFPLTLKSRDAFLGVGVHKLTLCPLRSNKGIVLAEAALYQNAVVISICPFKRE